LHSPISPIASGGVFAQLGGLLGGGFAFDEALGGKADAFWEVSEDGGEGVVVDGAGFGAGNDAGHEIDPWVGGGLGDADGMKVGAEGGEAV